MTAQPLSPDHRAARDEIRRGMRRQRRAVGTNARRAAAGALERHLAGSALFLRARHIALYLPNDGEIALNGLAERCWAMGKQCYLPVLSPAFHNRLWFAPYSRGAPLQPNRFGILEPFTERHRARPAWGLDLVLAPLVAFDAAGNRLGMGGGFYDRTLAYLHRRRCWHKPHLVGVAYGFQEVAQLPGAPWDVPLRAIATEQGWLPCAQR